MAYVLPQALVFQEFQSSPSEITDPLRACILGPNADLHRYAEADEKDDISLGEYNPSVDESHAWPGRSAGGLVDQDYAKVFIDDALLQFFEDLVGSDSTITPVNSYKNRIRSDSVNFAANGATYPRDSSLLRDVQNGDTAYVRGTVGGTSYDLWTYVRDLLHDKVAATVGTAYHDTNNADSQNASATAEQISGPTNCLEATVDATSYDGRPDGDINETYTLVVTKGSIDGDLTTAEVRVTSASGNDDVATFVPAAAGSDKEVGSRGLKVGWQVGGAGSSCSSGEPGTAEDLIAGQEFRVTVAQEFEAARVRADGTYSGNQDTTYVVEVTRGGAFTASEKPQITVTTIHGTDLSGPTNVTSDDVNVAIGTKGVTISFLGSEGSSSVSSSSSLSADELAGLRKGDKFYVPVTAESNGRVSTLQLGHNLPDELLTANDLELKLYIKKDIEVSQNREEAPPLLNWETSSTQITIKSGITALDTSWDDGSGPVPLPVKGGTVYAEYREWLPDLCGSIGALTVDSSLDDDIPGPLHPDNPLKWALSKAEANANGTTVKYIAICDPDDTDDWLDARDRLIGRDDIYNLVPLTRNKTVLDAFAGHVKSQSSAEAGRWRAMFLSLDVDETTAIVSSETSDDDSTVLATLEDDPDTTGTQYTLMTITSGNADLVELGVRAGDIVRYNYTTDGFGNLEYDEFTVDAVINDSELRLFSGDDSPQAVAERVEIWRNRSKSELADDIAAQAASYGSSRVCAVWPDVVSSGGTEMEGYHLCAALAGLASGVVPHQSLTNVELSGFDDVDRTTELFNADQLNTMADAGAWIVTTDDSGSIITRHGVTTDDTDLNTREEMIRRNVDSISYLFLRRVAKFIGRANVTPSSLQLIRIELVSGIEFLKSNDFSERLGAQLIDGEPVEIRQHALLADRVVAVLDLTVPAPLNVLEVHLVI